jgi:hypothetical protein
VKRERPGGRRRPRFRRRVIQSWHFAPRHPCSINLHGRGRSASARPTE